MLADHGRKGAAYRSVVANTVAAFALGDYEWILPMESDSLTDLVDMMRDLRATEARLHVREEVPFFTGRRIELGRGRRGAAVTAAVNLVRARDATPRRDGPRARTEPVAYDAHPARQLRRPRGPGRRHPVPPQRHARPRHPRRAARGGRAPLPRLRRREPDQRAEPRAEGRARGRAGRARHRPAGATGATATGRRTWTTRCSEAQRARLHQADRDRHERLQLVLALPPVPRGLRARARRRPGSRATVRSTRCASSSTTPASSRPSSRACETGLDGAARSASPASTSATETQVLFSTHSHPVDGRRAQRTRGPRLRRGRRLRGAAPRGRGGRDAARPAGGRRRGSSCSSRAAVRRASRGSSPTSTT